jgi:hypothetical protein
MHDPHDENHEPSQEDIDRGYEQTDLNAKAIATFLAIIAVILVLTGVTMLGLHFVLGEQNLRSEPPASPLALDRQLPPEPRLQALPSVDLKKMRIEDAARLGSYGWVSREAKVVRLPIDRAMQLLAERKLPVFPITPPEQFQPGSSIGTPAAMAPATAAPAPAPATSAPAPVPAPETSAPAAPAPEAAPANPAPAPEAPALQGGTQ